MRQRPGTIMLAFVDGGRLFVCGLGWFGPPDPPIEGCNVTSPAYHIYEIVKQYDAIIRGTNPTYLPNGYFQGGGFIDYSRAGFPEAFANHLIEVIDWSIFDGIFVDELCDSTLWAENGDTINYAYSGFASLAAFDAAYRAGVIQFLQRLRDGMGPNRYLCGNGCQLTPSFVNGWMRENFPQQNGGTWLSNMFGWLAVPADDGYMGNSKYKQAPQLCWLQGIPFGGTGAIKDADNIYWSRMLLGAATLANGVGLVTHSSNDQSRGRFFWVDEFSVGPTGIPEPTGAYRGWLGQPIEDAYDLGAGMYKREFEHGMVLVNPTASQKTFALSAPFVYIGGASANPTAVIPAGDVRFLRRIE
jgi:hypothetical protein